jgi:cellulose synthase/poly-beta-1,6-N-acetylglucosamine synthase-like glycosyltransferase
MVFTPTVTLLITAYNEEEVISKKLDNSLGLDYPKDHLQVLVAADGSDDRTAEIVSSHKERGVELCYNPERRGKMAAINRAVHMARGEILVFSDANNFYAPNTLRELIRPFVDPAVGAVSGSKHINKDDSAVGASEGLYWKYESFVKKQEYRFDSCVGVAGEILAIRRNLFQMPPDNIINDDFFIAMLIARRGFRIAYAPEACSFEPASISAEEEVIRRARISAGRFQAILFAHKFLSLRRPVLAWQVMSHKFLRPLLPFAMLGALAANLLAVLFPGRSGRQGILVLDPPYNWALLSLQLFFYLLALVAPRMKNMGLVGKILYLPTFFINSNYAALMGLFRFLTGKQSVLWERVSRKND